MNRLIDQLMDWSISSCNYHNRWFCGTNDNMCALQTLQAKSMSLKMQKCARRVMVHSTCYHTTWNSTTCWRVLMLITRFVEVVYNAYRTFLELNELYRVMFCLYVFLLEAFWCCALPWYESLDVPMCEVRIFWCKGAVLARCCAQHHQWLLLAAEGLKPRVAGWNSTALNHWATAHGYCTVLFCRISQRQDRSHQMRTHICLSFWVQKVQRLRSRDCKVGCNLSSVCQVWFMTSCNYHSDLFMCISLYYYVRTAQGFRFGKFQIVKR